MSRQILPLSKPQPTDRAFPSPLPHTSLVHAQCVSTIRSNKPITTIPLNYQTGQFHDGSTSDDEAVFSKVHHVGSGPEMLEQTRMGFSVIHFSNESGSLESQYEELLKSALRLRRSNAHSARTALCGAVLASSGTGTMVSVIPRPVPRHQRLDARRSPLGCLAAKKKLKPSLASTNIAFFC